MIQKLNAVLVVEGKSDVSFLSNYIDALFVTTNGSDVPISTIEYLKELSKTKEIIVLTDPDHPGNMIRNKLDDNIPNLKHCYINKEKAIKHNKVGVAEADIDEVLNSLKHFFVQSKDKKGILSMSDMYDLKLSGHNMSEDLRNLVSNHYHLGHNNAKSLLNKLNVLCITKEDIVEVIRNA